MRLLLDIKLFKFIIARVKLHQFHEPIDVWITCPAVEADLITTKMDILVRKHADHFFDQISQQLISCTSCRINRSKLAIWL